MQLTDMTPAPWGRSVFDRVAKDIPIWGDTRYGNNIASVYFDDCDHDEQEANARIIQRAPEMYNIILRLAQIDALGNGGIAQEARDLLEMIDG